jgi:hypothetical protein
LFTYFGENVFLQLKRKTKMATIILEYNPRVKGAVDLLNRIKESGFFTNKTKIKRKSGIEESMKDIEMGRVYKAKDVEDLFKQLEM